jgi:hypothetical protein
MVKGFGIQLERLMANAQELVVFVYREMRRALGVLELVLDQEVLQGLQGIAVLRGLNIAHT